MKTMPKDIAQALVECARAELLPDLPGLCDAALQLMAKRGHEGAFRSFPRLVERALLRDVSVMRACLHTPDGAAGVHAEHMKKRVESALHKRVEMEEEAAPRLLGGGMLAVGDERFDGSLAAGLRAMERRLLEPLPEMH